jgi:hypothetical protein
MHRRARAIGFACLVVAVAAGALRVSLRATTDSMVHCGREFLASLSADQRAKAVVSFDSPQRVDWNFVPKDQRKGLQIKDMDKDQRQLALALLRSGLSQVGYDKATQIMALELLLHELEKAKTGTPLRDAERYYFTLYGEPSADGRWGWSAEGHHLSFNFAVDAGQIVSTPSFYGSNPALIMDDYGIGPKKGTRILGQEEQLGFDLLHALDPEQRKTALIAEKAPAEILTAGTPQPKPLEPAGISSDKLNAEQQKIFQALLETHARNMAPELSAERLAEVNEAGPGSIYFAWAGADKPGIGHYYRVQAPTFLIEFINVQPDAAGNVANHIHIVWRSYQGDFGLQP